MKKILSVFLVCLMLAGAVSVSVTADNDTLLVSAGDVSFDVRVEGIKGNLLYKKGESAAAGTVLLDALKALLDGEKIAYQEADGYVSKIGEDAAATFGGWDGWVYYINGAEASVGMNDYVIQNGDSFVVCYADPYGDPATLFPQVSAERDAKGIVTLVVSASVASFDENWNMSVEIRPVADATVTVDGTALKSGADGRVRLGAEDSKKDKVTVQLDKTAENGKPLVVRLAADHTVSLADVKFVPPQFSDVAEGQWYHSYVYELANSGVIGGYADGSFRPDKSVTRAEICKMLAMAAPEADLSVRESKFSDVSADAWYAPYVVWAEKNGVVLGSDGKFDPNADVKRQDLAVMLCRFAENVLKKQVGGDAPAPSFTDAASIREYAAESVYLLQKAGIIGGFGDGSFGPARQASRAQFCKMLSGLLAA